MFIAYKNRFFVLLDMFLIGIKSCDLTFDLTETYFVVVYFFGGLACVDLQDSATSKSENTSL